MSKHGARPGKLHITSDGVASRVRLDGEDISRALVGVRLNLGVGVLPQATLDVLVHDLTTETEGQVVLPEATRDLLVRLGWTPPAEEATP
jgi:hypothetical protein